MIRSEVIELSNQLTERKGEKVLNLQSLYRFVVQDICKRQRFWWRRVAFSFPLVAGQTTYDLTKIVPTPATALTEIALDEITQFTVILAPNPLQTAQLTPTFDPETLIEMLNNTTSAAPSRYTMAANDYKTLLLDPPDLAYIAYIVGWGMANPASDSTSDAVPMIPPWGHNTIVAGMNAKIFKFAYGSKNEKTVDAQEEYELGLQDLMQRKQFDPNYKLQMNSTADESGFMTGAIRST